MSMRATKKWVVATAHRHSQSRKIHQCWNRISDKDGSGLMERRVGHRNYYSLEETQQQKPLLHVRILWECAISPDEPVHFRAVAKLTTSWLYHNTKLNCMII
ncbi:hypothetical protein EVAR_19006_1 [Eumeta japonica]|uniref:Mariner Mos1 transposase n=1 Tax=Eumeta variegata TaxID=151549 RepID=A0A4C1VAD5_EUMVA|nr:hypothetical protein EVAR_19006_1 [Eumeta japonica]